MRPPNPRARATNLLLARDVKALLIAEARKRRVSMAAVVAIALAVLTAAPAEGRPR